ncbi:hypothetical protein KW795_02875 [Candidatus Microgenomates bacterium]|nr:hypothetical protein [Candidatus Microgenomates bacterium]
MERTILYPQDRKLIDIESHITRDQNGKAINVDMCGLSSSFSAATIESNKDKDIIQRIYNPRLANYNNQIVIDMKSREKRKDGTIDDVRKGYSRNCEFDSLESAAGDKIAEMILKFDEETGEDLSEDVGVMYFYISPPTNDPESLYDSARIGIGQVRKILNHKIMESYGVPIELSPSDCLYLFHWMEEFTNDDCPFVTTAEETRDKIVIIRDYKQSNLTDFMNLALPIFSNLWEAIKNGDVARNNRETVHKTRTVIKRNNTVEKLLSAKSAREIVRIGANVEEIMSRANLKFFSSNCGLTNNELLRTTTNQISTPNHLSVSVIQYEQAENHPIEKKMFCCTCPVCNKKVEAEISCKRIYCPSCKSKAIISPDLSKV